MIEFSTEKSVYQFCSTCRARMAVSYSDGDVYAARCPDQHESILTYKTFGAFKKYALVLFAPKIGTGDV